MREYFRARRIELVICYLVVFMAMCLLFQIKNNNFQEIAENNSTYLTYALGLFSVYIYFSFQTRKIQISFIKRKKYDLYMKIKTNKILLLLYRYYPIVMLITLFLPEITLSYLSVNVWFYIVLLIQFIFTIYCILFSNKMIREYQ